MAILPSLILIFTINLMVHWATEYCKPIHTNLYLNAHSHHHPSNEQAVLFTLAHRARDLCDRESLHDGLEFLTATFKQNSYSDQQIQWAVSPLKRVAPAPEKPISVTIPPFVSMTFSHISQMLSRQNIKPVGLPPRKIPSFLWPVKDDMALKTQGVSSL
jgi:hypothetical protein